MTRSLRFRLFATLLLATGAIWLAAVAWIYIGGRREVEHVLDARLQEAARMVASLAEGLGRPPSSSPAEARDIPGLGNYERQLSCQIWSLDGRMIAKSGGAPEQRLTKETSGFSERVIDGEKWRVYAVEDAVRSVRVLVGDRLGLRDRLAADLVKGLLWPAFLIAPTLGFVIWVSIGRGLDPLRRTAHDLRAREADDMRPVDTANAPSEIRPLATAINELFEKVEDARRHEREVTAFAAHELRTPLAGLKTQAQVALAADDPGTIRAALHQIIVAVDRSARLVRQLLAIARLDARAEIESGEHVSIGPLLKETINATVTPENITVVLEGGVQTMIARGNRDCIELALRNLHENAVQHMTAGGVVQWSRTADCVFVTDDGPGIPNDELKKIGTRFFRGRFKSPCGTGLGVAIAILALERVGATLRLTNRSDAPGLCAEVVFDPARIQSQNDRAASNPVQGAAPTNTVKTATSSR